MLAGNSDASTDNDHQIDPRTAEDSDMIDPIYQRAIEQLVGLFEEASNTDNDDPSAASLATADKHARPSVRIVNVARISTAGLLVFAHSRSGKGQHMQQNPRAALCFYWPELNQQVIAEGEVAILSDSDADAAWGHRPRDVGLGHWASDQIGTPEQEQTLKDHLEDARHRFSFERVPRPPDWYGFEVRPDRIEFWKTGWGRLKSRVLFQRNESGLWTEDQANP